MLKENESDPLLVSGQAADAPGTAGGQLRLDLAAQTLQDEVRARWGGRALTYESSSEQEAQVGLCASHFPDSQGVKHALDLRIDVEGNGKGLSVEDGIWLAEYLRGFGWRTGRFISLVHRGQIAGDFSGWRWQRYRGAYATMDRIHLNVCDVVQGEPSQVGPEIYDSTESWGIRAA